MSELSPPAGTPFTAGCDGDGLRVSKTENWTGSAQTHQYTWGPGGVVYDSLNSATYTPGSAQRVNGTDRFPAADWLGSTRYLSDSSGNSFPAALRFDAFGNRSATGGTDPYDPSDFQFGAGAGYQTEYASATEPGLGLQYLEQRYYDPAVGRFISGDPLGYIAGLNLYAYCGNNPVMLADPLGLLGWSDVADFATNRYVLGIGTGILVTGLTLGNVEAGALAGSLVTSLVSRYRDGNPPGVAFVDGLAVGLLVPEAAIALNQLEGAVAYSRTPVEQTLTRDAQEEIAAPGEGLVGCKGGSAQSAPAETAPAQQPRLISSKAPPRVTPGVRILRGQHIDNRGRVSPWTAYYDGEGRQIARTDYNAGNKAQRIPDTHYHLFQWGKGMTYKPLGMKHIAGEYVPDFGE